MSAIVASGPLDLLGRSSLDAVDEDTGEVFTIRTAQENPRKVEGVLVSFSYSDVAGEVTRRAVLCWRTWTAHGEYYLRGLCFLRRSLRTFRIDRMTDLQNARTGGVIANPTAFFAEFIPYAPAPHEGYGTPQVTVQIGTLNNLQYYSNAPSLSEQAFANGENYAASGFPAAANIGTKRKTKSIVISLGFVILLTGLSIWKFDQIRRKDLRVEYVALVRSSFSVARPDITVSSDEDQALVLRLSSPKIDFRDAQNLARVMPSRIQDLGFSAVVFSNGKDEWPFKVETKSFQ